MTKANQAIQKARMELATELETATPSTRILMAYATVEQTGGSFIPARLGDQWASHMAELDMLGIISTGHDEASAVANWIKHTIRIATELDAQRQENAA